MLTLFAPYQSLCAQVNCNNSNVVVTASWAMLNTLGLTPNTITDIVSSNAQFTIVGQDNETQLISFVSLVNTDNANTQNVQLILQTAVSSGVLYQATLPAGWGLFYIDGFGFQVLDATGYAVPSAYDATASSTANAAYAQANAAYTEANTANALAQSAYSQANTANLVAQTAIIIAEDAYLEANLAYAQANLAVINVSSGNTSNLVISGTASNVIIDTRLVSSGGGNGGGGNYQVDVYANSAGVLPNVVLNFNNTATVNVTALANGTGTAANVQMNANVAAIAGPASAQANAAFLLANSDGIYAQGVLVQANTSNLNFINCGTSNAVVTANGTSNTNIFFTVNSTAVLANIVSGNTSNVSVTQNTTGIVLIDTLATGGGSNTFAGQTFTQQNIVLGNLLNSANYTYFNVGNVGLCTVGLFYIQSNTPAAQYNLVVRGSANNNGTMFLAANSVTSNTYNLSYPWMYQSDSSATGDTNLYIGIQNLLAINTKFTLTLLKGIRFSNNPATAVASTIDSEQFVALANQSVFSLVNSGMAGNNYVIVSVNGLTLEPTTHYGYNATTGNLTILANCTLGDIVEVRELIGQSIVGVDVSNAIYAQANNGPVAAVAAANGYIQYGLGGIIDQWGFVSQVGGTPNPKDFSVTFPIAFPNACWQVIVTGDRNETASGQSVDGSNYSSNRTKTGCTITVDANTTGYYGMWRAIGN